MDQHERNIQHSPNSNRAVTIKHQRVYTMVFLKLRFHLNYWASNIVSYDKIYWLYMKKYWAKFDGLLKRKTRPFFANIFKQ